MNKLTRVFTCMLICLVLFGCKSKSASAEKSTDFTLPSMDGGNVSLSDFRGKKVLVDFFATWCPPCRREMSEINEIVTEYPEGNYEILCVSVDNSMNVVKKFIDSNGYKMKVLFDDQNVSSKYGVQAIPSLYLVDEKAPNAFATGRDPEHAVLAVTEGLLAKLNAQEIEGVIAHELSHIQNKDMLLQTMIVVLVGFISILSRWFVWGQIFGGRR
ncbi:redoxin domain-containing protein, partial [bacterium]|nr:redoxin domain-containing protein [bacterium]